MNNKVTVTGMTITTQVSNNLLIAPFVATDTAKEGNTDSAYTNALHQTRIALLEPSSTINGVDFYYTSTSNVKADGDAIAEVYTAYNENAALAHADAGKTNHDAAFNTNYGITTPAATATGVAYGYLDYIFYLKATNTDAAPRDVYMDKCNLLYKGSTADVTKAWRVAMFVQDVVAETKVDNAIASTDVVTILTPNSAVNQTSTDYAVGDNNGTPTVMDLAYGTSSAITGYNQAATVVDDLAAGETGYYKITIRLWLEGEDKECKNDTFASLTEDWRLDLEFSIGTGTGVNLIGSVANAVTTDATTATVKLTDGKLDNGETPASYQWKNADGTNATGASATTVSFTTSESTPGTYNYYCEITTNKGNVYRTNNVTLTVS